MPNRIYYQVALVETKINVNIIGSVLKFIFCLSVPYLGYCMIVNTFIIVYLVSQTKSQLMIMNEYLKIEFQIDHTLEEYDLLRDRQYQCKVAEKLKSCIEHHVRLKE